MWKVRDRRLLTVTAACGAALAMAVACSAEDRSGTGDTAGAGGSDNTSGSSAGGAGGTTGTSGSANGGATVSAGTNSGGSATGGSGGGTSGSANGGFAPGGHANGGTGGSGQAGDTGSAGAPGFPILIPLLNPGFEVSTPNMTASGWPTVPPCPGAGMCTSYMDANTSTSHTGFGRLALYSGSAYVVSTSQTVSGLADGTYELAAWATAGIGLVSGALPINSLYLFAEGYDPLNATNQMKTDIPSDPAYAQYMVTNIVVTSGTLTIGVFIDANPGNYANLDDFTLTQLD